MCQREFPCIGTVLNWVIALKNNQSIKLYKWKMDFLWLKYDVETVFLPFL